MKKNIALVLLLASSISQAQPQPQSGNDENTGCRIILERGQYASVYEGTRMFRKKFVIKRLQELGYTIVGDEAKGTADQSKADLSISVTRGVPYGAGVLISVHRLHFTDEKDFSYFERHSFHSNRETPHIPPAKEYLKNVMLYEFPACPPMKKHAQE